MLLRVLLEPDKRVRRGVRDKWTEDSTVIMVIMVMMLVRLVLPYDKNMIVMHQQLYKTTTCDNALLLDRSRESPIRTLVGLGGVLWRERGNEDHDSV